jgi:hypothetical protein
MYLRELMCFEFIIIAILTYVIIFGTYGITTCDKRWHLKEGPQEGTTTTDLIISDELLDDVLSERHAKYS